MVNTVNLASLVGMVDPVEGASYVIPEQVISVEVILIKDIMFIVKLTINMIIPNLLKKIRWTRSMYSHPTNNARTCVARVLNI